MLVRLEQEDFWHPRFDPIVVGISDAYAEVRALEEVRSTLLWTISLYPTYSPRI